MVERFVVITYEELLRERHSSKSARVIAAREALSEVFGRNRTKVHAGSNTYGEDTTHFLYITLCLKKGDKRNGLDYETNRKEIIGILQEKDVPLYETSYYLSQNDDFAVSLDIENYKPQVQNPNL